MSEFYLGAYWRQRPLTLRRYADATKAFLLLLQKVHPLFHSMEWVGDRPNSAVKISPDLGNLDDLIYRHAGGKDQLYDVTNPDKTPTWHSVSEDGYAMTFNSGKSAASGGVTLSISAGERSGLVSNAVAIAFPSFENPEFPHREFYRYEFVKYLFVEMIRFWNPETGRVTSYDFSKAVVSNGLPGVGWLTYLRDPRAMALRNDASMKDLTFETVDGDDTLISLERQLISPDNLSQVERAARLRGKLIAENLIKV